VGWWNWLVSVLVDHDTATVDQIVGDGQVCDDLINQCLEVRKASVSDGGSRLNVGGQLFLQINWVEAT
jgi:hypothetical protein